MSKIIITCNAGSSNTKLAAFAAGTLELIETTQTHNDADISTWFKKFPAENMSAIGHRVVHGGDKLVKPTPITPEILQQLNEFTPLAPLHQPMTLKFISEISRLYPDTPNIACFDTAFHHNIPEIEKILPLPKSYYDSGIKRYGFHGLSYEYIASVLPESLRDKRVIVAHLGNGSSMCAMNSGRSIATTMGFSTLDGLMMGTRAGNIDPGVILYLLQEKGLSTADIEKLLYKESGLLGISGISSDMRELLASTKPQAKLAVELYCHLAARQLASLIPCLGGIDGIIFTGGIGEHAQQVREKILSQLQWLGKIETHVIATNEELVIAKACSTLAG